MVGLFTTRFSKRVVLLTSIEGLILLFGLLLAVRLQFGTNLDAEIYLLYERGLAKVALVSAIFILLVYHYNLYSSATIANHREVFTRFVGVMGSTFLALGLIYYEFPGIRLEAEALWEGLSIAGAGVVAWRMCFMTANKSARFAENVLLFGDGALCASLIEETARHPELGVRVAGIAGAASPLFSLPCISTEELTGEYLREHRIRRIIVTLDDRRGKLPVATLLRLKAQGIAIQDGAEYYEAAMGRIPVESLRLSWLLFSPGFHVSPALRLYKRVFSLVLGSIALVLFAPLMLIIAVAIRLDSSGPVIFRQKRVGEYGRVFTIYKFRTMHHLADGQVGEAKHTPNEVGHPPECHDRRITRIGHLLRQARLDELPQLANIIKGDMAFVGPRPVPPEEEEECAAQIPFYKQRWMVKPGATGWAQINRGYNATVEDHREKLAYDLFYIKNISPGLDAYTAFATWKAILWGKSST